MRTLFLSRLLFTGAALGSEVCSVRPFTSSTMANQPPPVIVPAKEEHKATVIFLHGLGDQGDGWADMFRSEIREKNIKYICPSSASRPVTLNMGMSMPAWFDLLGLDPSAREDDAGIAAANDLVHSMINAEVEAGIPSENIILGGFSMGGALAIFSGLTYPKKLGGIVALSSFLIQRTVLASKCQESNKRTPIFMGHGGSDFLVSLKIGETSKELLSNINSNVNFKVYPGMAHSSCPEEIKDVKNFIRSNVNI